MSCDSTASARRCRSTRYSSVCMSSTESSPLFTTPVSGHGQIPNDLLRSGSDRGALNPLASAGIMLATNELDRTVSRAEQASEVRFAPSLTPKGPGVAMTPLNSTPSIEATSRRSLGLSENVNYSPTLEGGTCASASDQHSLLIKSPLSRSLTDALCVLRKSQRRKASSRQSEICTPEDIPEVSDEDLSGSDSASTFTSAVEHTPSELCSRNGGLLSSDANLLSVDGLSIQKDAPAKSDNITDPVDQAFERARLTQGQPPKVMQLPAMTRRSKTPGLRVEFAIPPVALSAPDLEPQSPKSPGDANNALGSRPRLHGSSSYPGPTPYGSRMSNWTGGTSTPLARAVMSDSITPENTRGLWCPPRPRTPAVKRGQIWSHDASFGGKKQEMEMRDRTTPL